MNKSIFIIILICMLFLFGFTENHLQLITTIGSEEDTLLYRWVNVAVDEKDNIYVTDMLDCSVKKFDQNGNFIKKIGRRGSGPGEFIAPATIRFQDGLLYVSEQQTPGIQVFDNDLNFKYKITFSIPINDFHVFNENLILLLSPLKSSYFYMDKKGNIFKIISFQKELSENMFLIMKKIAVDNAGNKYFLSQFKGELNKYDKYDKKIWTLALKNASGEIKFKRLIPGMDVPEKMLYKGITVDKNGRILILVGQAPVNSSRLISILDPSGNKVGEIVLPEASHCLYCDSNNRIYVGRNQGTSLKVYKLDSM